MNNHHKVHQMKDWCKECAEYERHQALMAMLNLLVRSISERV